MKGYLVAGGASGVGVSICRALSAKGFPVIVHYRSKEREAKELVQELGCWAVFADLEKPEGIRALKGVEAMGLINVFGPFSESFKSQEAPGIFQNNVFAQHALIEALEESLIINQGSVVNFGMCGLGTGKTDTMAPLYFAAKGALWSLTRSWAKLLAEKGVRVNMISPGYLEESTVLPKRELLPQNRLVSFDEIVSMVVYLLSEASRSITGQNIEIAGAVRL